MIFSSIFPKQGTSAIGRQLLLLTSISDNVMGYVENKVKGATYGWQYVLLPGFFSITVVATRRLRGW
jgi:hypothetical protein